jgi:hypothetical protein
MYFMHTKQKERNSARRCPLSTALGGGRHRGPSFEALINGNPYFEALRAMTRTPLYYLPDRSCLESDANHRITQANIRDTIRHALYMSFRTDVEGGLQCVLLHSVVRPAWHSLSANVQHGIHSNRRSSSVKMGVPAHSWGSLKHKALPMLSLSSIVPIMLPRCRCHQADDISISWV